MCPKVHNNDAQLEFSFSGNSVLDIGKKNGFIYLFIDHFYVLYELKLNEKNTTIQNRKSMKGEHQIKFH